MNKKLKIVLAVSSFLFLVVAVAATVFLVRQRQEIRKKAAVPEGKATVSLSPTSITKDVNTPFPVQIKFNTNGVAISAFAIHLSYSYSEDQPPVTVEGNQITISAVLGGQDWSCPIKQTSHDGGKYYIDIACINTNPAGYSNSTDTILASFNLIASKVPAINPLVLTFDPGQSIITKKADGQDTLLIPTSSGSYTISGVIGKVCDLSFSVTGPTPTPTETPTLTPTPSPTPTLPPGATPTPTPTTPPGVTATPTPTLPPGVTPTPTSVAQIELPEAGIVSPTILVTLGGLALIILSLLF